jgi:hypothetical protein
MTPVLKSLELEYNSSSEFENFEFQINLLNLSIEYPIIFETIAHLKDLRNIELNLLDGVEELNYWINHQVHLTSMYLKSSKENLFQNVIFRNLKSLHNLHLELKMESIILEDLRSLIELNLEESIFDKISIIRCPRIDVFDLEFSNTKEINIQNVSFQKAKINFNKNLEKLQIKDCEFLSEIDVFCNPILKPSQLIFEELPSLKYIYGMENLSWDDTIMNSFRGLPNVRALFLGGSQCNDEIIETILNLFPTINYVDFLSANNQDFDVDSISEELEIHENWEEEHLLEVEVTLIYQESGNVSIDKLDHSRLNVDDKKYIQKYDMLPGFRITQSNHIMMLKIYHSNYLSFLDSYAKNVLCKDSNIFDLNNQIKLPFQFAELLSTRLNYKKKEIVELGLQSPQYKNIPVLNFEPSGQKILNKMVWEKDPIFLIQYWGYEKLIESMIHQESKSHLKRFFV